MAEKLALAFLVKLPPSVGPELNQKVLAILKVAPVFLVCNGFWMLSNRQIFENRWSYIMTEADGMKAQHFLELFPFKVDQATPLALVAVASLLVAAA